MLMTPIRLIQSAKIQQSVLEDDHPIVAHTMESIDYVEVSKENAIPSANDLLSKWADVTGDDIEPHQKPSAIICSSEVEPILTNFKAYLTPTGWYKRVEESMVGSSCVRNNNEVDDGSTSQLATPDSVARQEGDGKYSA